MGWREKQFLEVHFMSIDQRIFYSTFLSMFENKYKRLIWKQHMFNKKSHNLPSHWFINKLKTSKFDHEIYAYNTDICS